MKFALKLDGVLYPNIHIRSLRRSFQVLDGPGTGRTMSYDMIRDVGGTFYNYSMSIDSAMSSPEEYDAFYENISAPVASHSLEVPYAQGTLVFKAYVTNGDDDLVEMLDNQNVWSGLSFNFVAMSPQRRPG